MSYLSATENVGFSGIPQNISDGSCATQYKMAVEGVSGNCSEVLYIPDSSTEDSTYMTHLNDNFYTKFKIDPNELYTFHDSDVVAGEITVSHTEDTFVYPDSDDAKPKLDSPNKELDVLGQFANGDVKLDIKKKAITNGHYAPVSKPVLKEIKIPQTKVQKAKGQIKEVKRETLSEARKQNAQSPKAHVVVVSTSSSKSSINGIDTNNGKPLNDNKQSPNETFLDVFKREQGLVENEAVATKTDTQPFPPPAKIPMSPPKKPSGRTPSQVKARRGRGPAVHEALQRISSQRKAIPLPNMMWHAPGDNLFDCGPLDSKPPAFKLMDSSSSDDDNMPDFESGYGPVTVEEDIPQSRGARLALRRAALRRHVARAHDSLRLASGHRGHRALASIIRKQLNSPGSSGNLPTQTVNHLLALRGMSAILSPQERRKLRESGWSGGESTGCSICSVEACAAEAVPGARHCLPHVTRAPEQRLYAACAAVFAGGARCRAPVLPLRGHTPLCDEHAWKRDNYDKLVKEKPGRRPRRAAPALRRPPARRRRPPAPRPALPPPPTATHSLSEINVCSNSSTYDSSEDTAMGALSENEYITVADNSHELEVEVGHVPADDILDPAVLSQIPDEAFTEFFNQGIVLAEAGSSFGESSELAAALEAVLDERTLTEEHVSTSSETGHRLVVRSPRPTLTDKIPPASITMEVSSSASS